MRKYVASIWAWVCAHGPLVITFALVLAVDRVSKVLAQVFLPGNPVWVCPFLRLTYVQNTGSAFGMMQGANTLLIGVMVAIILYILYSWKGLAAQGKLVEWGCALILAGAFGNLYDRITLGYVVDFLDFLVWPVFNVADSAITVGAGLFVIALIRQYKKQEAE